MTSNTLPLPVLTSTPEDPVSKRELLDALGAAVLAVDAKLKLIECNTAGETLLAASRRRAIGSSLEQLLPGNPRLIETARAVLASERRYTLPELRLELRDSRQLTADCLLSPLATGVVLELRSRSERVAHERAIHTAMAVARESLRQLAHEVRNPLVGIHGAAQLLERELAGHTAYQEHLDIIREEAVRLSRLLERMLSGEQRPEPSQVNIHEVIDYVLCLVRADWPRGLRIKREYDPSLPELNVDREQLVQVFLNLIANAREAAGVSGHVILRTRAERQCTIGGRLHRNAVCVEVIDSGSGLSAGMEDSVFFPMVSGRPGGTGLGLSIAQSLVRTHGGSLEYRRQVDRQETVFAVLLPIETTEPAA